MKKFLIIPMVAVAITLMGAGCGVTAKDSNELMADKTEKQMKEMNAQVGMPAIVNFQEKKLAKQIFELRDREDLITYVYIVNWQGGLVYIGQAIGFGLPYSTQYTNPEKVIDPCKASFCPMTIPQADPNGLFMPEGLSATWIMMLDDKGIPHPVYMEPQIIVSPVKLI